MAQANIYHQPYRVRMSLELREIQAQIGIIIVKAPPRNKLRCRSTIRLECVIRDRSWREGDLQRVAPINERVSGRKH
jgi:hypothetical protein